MRIGLPLILAAALVSPLESQELPPVLVESSVGTWRASPQVHKMEAARHWLLLAMGDGLVPSEAVNGAAEAVVVCLDRATARYTPSDRMSVVVKDCILVIGD